MRWRTPFLLAAVAFMTVGCEQEPPTAPDGASVTATAPAFLMGGIGAVVTRGDIGCGLIDGYGNVFPPPVDGMWVGDCGHEVATYGPNGNAVWVMRYSGVPNPTGRTLHYGPYDIGNGEVAESWSFIAPGPYPCGVLGPDRDIYNPLYTIKWKQVLTPSGEATLTCHYTKKFEFQWPD